MNCWLFDAKLGSPPAYVMELLTYLPKQGEWMPLRFEVDTGFEGAILLSEHLFDSLGFSMFEEIRTESLIGATDPDVRIPLRSSHSNVRLPNSEVTFPVQIDTFKGNESVVVGRELLSQLFSQIDGFKQEFCCSETPPVA